MGLQSAGQTPQDQLYCGPLKFVPRKTSLLRSEPHCIHKYFCETISHTLRIFQNNLYQPIRGREGHPAGRLAGSACPVKTVLQALGSQCGTPGIVQGSGLALNVADYGSVPRSPLGPRPPPGANLETKPGQSPSTAARDPKQTEMGSAGVATVVSVSHVGMSVSLASVFFLEEPGWVLL